MIEAAFIFGAVGVIAAMILQLERISRLDARVRNLESRKAEADHSAGWN